MAINNQMQSLLSAMQDPTYGLDRFARVGRRGPGVNAFSQMMAMRGGSGAQAQEQFEANRMQRRTSMLDAFGDFQTRNVQNQVGLMNAMSQRDLGQRRLAQGNRRLDLQKRQLDMQRREQRGSLGGFLGKLGGTLLGAAAGPIGGAIGGKIGESLFS